MDKELLYEKIWESLIALRNRDTLFDVSSEVKEQRTNICKGCENYNLDSNSCSLNLASVDSMTRFMIEKCPVDKWDIDKSSWAEKLDSILS